jgi:hypothetical protein
MCLYFADTEKQTSSSLSSTWKDVKSRRYGNFGSEDMNFSDVAARAHKDYEDLLTAKLATPAVTIFSMPLANKSIPVIHALPTSQKAKSPACIPLYVACDNIKPGSREAFAKFDKKELLNVTCMYAEVVDGVVKTSTRKKHPQNPISKALQLVKIGHAQIDRVGSHNHKNKCVVKSTGIEELKGYCEVEVLDYHGVPNGSAFYIASYHLRPIPDYKWESELTDELNQLKKTNAKLVNENESLKARPVDTVQDEPNPGPGYDPKKVTTKMPRPGPDLRMSVADGNGMWKPREPAVEKPCLCTLCGKRYKSAHSLANHRYHYHGGIDKMPKTKNCEKCKELCPLNNFARHKCDKS